jgi:hypothetical protein
MQLWLIATATAIQVAIAVTVAITIHFPLSTFHGISGIKPNDARALQVARHHSNPVSPVPI